MPACGPSEGDPCTTEGASDFQGTCSGDDLLYCVCDEYEGSDCPGGEGTWVRQEIYCSCDTFMNDRSACPIE